MAFGAGFPQNGTVAIPGCDRSLVSTPPSETSLTFPPDPQPDAAWSEPDPRPADWPLYPAPSRKSLAIAIALFLLTLCTCLAAGAQFNTWYSLNRAVSLDEFFPSLALLFGHPAALLPGIPFALTLLAILLVHELAHFFACRHHKIRASYPFFLPVPTLIGTFGAFMVLRSPFRSVRALFDVGASGPLAGFVVAVPALVYGVMAAKIVPGIVDPAHADAVFGVPLGMRFLAALLHPGVNPQMLLLPPVGRAAWVGLFATSLNLLPVGQLDGGHILRSLSPGLHRVFTLAVPLVLLALGFLHFWPGWYLWGGLLLLFQVRRLFRVPPIYLEEPLDPARRFLALLALAVLVVCFMPAPFQFQ